MDVTKPQKIEAGQKWRFGKSVVKILDVDEERVTLFRYYDGIRSTLNLAEFVLYYTPESKEIQYAPRCENVTLRDYFATAALQGIVNANTVPDCQLGDGTNLAQSIAKSCYFMADAMMEERGKGDK